MPKTMRILIVVLFALSSAVFTKAQDVPNYLFLDIIDSNEKPIKDATVILKLPKWNTSGKDTHIVKKQSDNSGEVKFFLPHIRSDFTKSLFNISKTGYFDFFDFGVFMLSRDRVRAKIELLKIPKTPIEKKTIGNEQAKREFLWSAKRGDSETVKKFVKKNFSPNLSTNDLRGVSAPKDIPVVLFAAVSGDSKTLNILLKAGANVRSKEEPLHSILAYYLLANPTLKKEYKTTREKNKAVREYQKGIRSLLKAKAATKDMLTYNGLNILMITARQNDDESAELLIRHGIPVNYNINGYTALMNAVNQYGSNRSDYSPFKVAEVLLKAGADPNIAINPASAVNCHSVLMQSVWARDVELIKLLIKYKADVNFTCKNGDTALKWANRYPVVGDKYQQEIIKLLKASGAKL